MQKQSPEVFYKKRYFQKFRKLDRKTPALKLFLNKVAGFDRASFFLKKTPTQVLSCEVFETCTSTYFEEQLQTTASGGV